LSKNINERPHPEALAREVEGDGEAPRAEAGEKVLAVGTVRPSPSIRGSGGVL